MTDLLIEGPYVRGRLDPSRPRVGSGDQRYHVLTERYRHLQPELTAIPQRPEVRVHPDGRLEINGMITDAGLAELPRPFPSPDGRPVP